MQGRVGRCPGPLFVKVVPLPTPVCRKDKGETHFPAMDSCSG